ncbi:MAG: threonine/serine exporter family protein [Clostridia bacterium]|nr:threonine/serine exporter family protein [Clostridia bacterium]
MDIKQAIIIVLSGFVGSIGFSLLFRMNKQKIIFAAIGGGLTCLVYVVAFNFSEKSFFQNLFPALFATAYSEILARLTKSPSTPYIAISIIPLVPGSKLYYTMYYLITDNDLAFKEYFLETLRIAGGLGVGIILVSVIIREINYHKFKHIYDME